MAVVFFAAVAFMLGLFNVAADEIQWGDVAEDGSVDMRTLDIPVVMARGTDNFFEQDPMSAQDWAHTNVVTKSLHAFIKLAGSAKPDSKIDRLEESLRPIYQAMPKNHAGLLSNGTVHYALHRYFTKENGWSMKGLEPAGETWMRIMSVTPDVKEVSKYMLPTYLQDLLMKHYGSEGVNLRSLATMASILEHLVYGEMLNILYSVYSTVGLSTAGPHTMQEIDDIIDMFMMVYAFGFNMEVSTYSDMKKARLHLENKHGVWPHMRSLAETIKQKVAQSRGSNPMDFVGMLQITQEFTKQYAQFHSRDCKRAEDKLMAMPSQKYAEVVAEDFKESHETGFRPLFTESLEQLASLGVMDHATEKNISGVNVGQKRLIIPNYIHSQALCLSTVSFYSVCCPNECENFLGILEREIVAPEVEPARLHELIASRLPNAADDANTRLTDFNAIALTHNGKVPLHSREFSAWLHRAFPLQCPMPNDMAATNPKTADEWIRAPDDRFKDLEDLMNETATALAKFTAMGGHIDPEEVPEEEVPQDNEVISLQPNERYNGQLQPHKLSLISTVFYGIAIVSMIVIASRVVTSGLTATGHGPSDKIKVAQYRDFDCLA